MQEEYNQADKNYEENKKHAHIDFKKFHCLFINFAFEKVVFHEFLVSGSIVSRNRFSRNGLVQKIAKRLPSIFDIPNKQSVSWDCILKFFSNPEFCPTTYLYFFDVSQI